MKKKNFIDFSDMSGGKNTTDPPHAVLDNQVCDTLNLLHENVGLSRAPGYLGLNTDSIGTVTGLIRFLTDAGTEIIIVIDTEKIYSFNTSTGEFSELYTITTSENRWTYVNSCGKVWLCNGIEFLSIDDELNVYPVGLPVPEYNSQGFTIAAITADGELMYGTYKAYCAYVTTDNVGRKMYSYPLYLGEATISSPHEDGSLLLYFKYSESARVDHIAFFITDPDGEVPYLYYEIDNVLSGGDGYYFLRTDAYKNELITVSSVSLSNTVLPFVPDNIYTFDSRIFIWENKSKTIYFSLKSDVNPFDLERFLSANFRLMPKSVDSMFSVGSDLFFNHIGNGISVAYFGDMASVVKHINRQYWFLDCTTQEGKTNVVYINGMVFGLTNDGFRFFDGNGFSDDVSSSIKPEIDRIYTVISNKVSACVYRRPGKRTEYRFSYENSEYGLNGNNAQILFNIDNYFNLEFPKKTWEFWENGFEFMLSGNNGWIGCQVGSGGSYIVKESGVTDKLCYNKLRLYCDEKYVKKSYVLSKTIIANLDSIGVWGSIYGLAKSKGNIYGNIITFDNENKRYPFELSGASVSGAVLPSQSSGLGLALPFVMKASTPSASIFPMPWDCQSNCVAIEVFQEDDDEEFFIYKLQLPRIFAEQNMLT